MNYKKYLSQVNEGKKKAMIWKLLDIKKLSKQLSKMDEQSKKLVTKIVSILGSSLTLHDSQGQAFNELDNLIESGSTDEANLRNKVFKIANELGIKLPSSSF